MWWSYRELHKAWRRNVAIARREGDKWWLRKLLHREPQEPFSNGMRSKVPIWFDSRFGSIEKSKRIKLCPYVGRVSTLQKGAKLTIPLNPAKYHLNLLEHGTLKSFQLVKRHGKYYVHVKTECHSSRPARPCSTRNRPWSEAVRGVRDVATESASKVQRLLNSDGRVEAGSTEPLREANSGTATGTKVGVTEKDTTQATACKRTVRPPRRETSCHNIPKLFRRGWLPERHQVHESKRQW